MKRSCVEWAAGTFARPRASARASEASTGGLPREGQGGGTPTNKERAGEGSFATAQI